MLVISKTYPEVKSFGSVSISSGSEYPYGP